MTGRPVLNPLRRALLAAGLAGAGAALAQKGAAGGTEPAGELPWLEQIQAAAERLSYSGTVVHQRGGEVRSSRLHHLFDGQQTHERVQLLDGNPRELIRRGNEVQELLPEARRVRIVQRVRLDAFPALATRPAAEVLTVYRVQVGGVERVAGHDSRVLIVEPKDAHRFGYRLWVEQANRLLLKAQVLGPGQEVLEQVAFSEVRIGGKFDRTTLRPSWPTTGWAVERSELRPLDPAQAGWTMAPPPGFRVLHAVGRSANGERTRLQVVYSDGLASFSVFIEPMASQTVPGGAVLVDGPTSFVARRVGDSLVTVVGEVPPQTVRAVAGSVQPRPAR